MTWKTTQERQSLHGKHGQKNGKRITPIRMHHRNDIIDGRVLGVEWIRSYILISKKLNIQRPLSLSSRQSVMD